MEYELKYGVKYNTRMVSNKMRKIFIEYLIRDTLEKCKQNKPIIVKINEFRYKSGRTVKK